MQEDEQRNERALPLAVGARRYEACEDVARAGGGSPPLHTRNVDKKSEASPTKWVGSEEDEQRSE